MLVEPRHDLDEVAGSVPVIELELQDAVPGVAAGARAAGQHENESGIRDAAGRARLDRGGADLVVGNAVKDLREALHALLEQWLDRLGRDVAAREARAARRDDHIHFGVLDPGPDGLPNLLLLVRHDLSRGEPM